MASSCFDLRRNPFARLRVGPADRAEAVQDAFERRLLDGDADEPELLRARQDLAAPRRRLEAELGWLPGAPQELARAILTWLEREGGFKQDLLDGLHGLARANLAAHFCARCGAAPALEALLAAQAEISPDVVVAALDLARRAAGLPAVDEGLLAEPLGRLLQAHAEAAMVAVDAAASPPDVMAHLVGKHRGQPPAARQLLDELVRRYGRSVDGELARLEEAIDAAAQAVLASPTLEELLARLEDLVRD